jgi:hypothetical protein
MFFKFLFSAFIVGLIIISCSNRNFKNIPTDSSKSFNVNDTITPNKSSNDKINLSGHWQWESKSSTFELDIVQTGDSLKGSYCAVALNGNRIDCNDNDSDGYCLISGVLENNEAKIVFNSAFSDPELKDTAEVVYNIKNKTLLWTWTQKNIVAYVPNKAILKK